MLNKLKAKLRGYIHAEVLRAAKDLLSDDNFICIFSQMQQFVNAPDNMLASKVEALTDIDNLVSRFVNLGVPVKKEKIDANDFENWIRKYPEMSEHYDNYGDVKTEKLLEHYLTTRYLNIKGGIYIDIASATSPFAKVISKHTGCKGYSQDLVFEECHPSLKTTPGRQSK